MAQQFLFSTGVLYVALASAGAFTDADIVGAVQSADFDLKFETKEVREAAHINVYAVADVDYDANSMLKVEFTDLKEKLIEYCTGAVKSTTGGKNIYTHNGKSLPKYVKVKLVGQLSDGREATIEIDRCKAPGMPLGMKRDDFTTPSIEFTVRPIDADADAVRISFDV